VRQLRIFVSYSSADNLFGTELVAALRQAGADVWHDQDNLRAGRLLERISHELRSRPIFIVIISPAAFVSEWVQHECRWAWSASMRESDRIILPVVAERVDSSVWLDHLYLDEFKRIEAPGDVPYPKAEAIEKTLAELNLSSRQASEETAAGAQREDVKLLNTRGRAYMAQEEYEPALALFMEASRRSPSSYSA
jgi:hypothetical protein